MELNQLLQKYLQQEQTRRLIRFITEPNDKRVHLEGLSGSSDAMVLAAVQTELPHPALFLLGDREEAAYFQNDLENLLGEQKAILYPASYKKAYQLDQPDNNLVLQRAEVLTLPLSPIRKLYTNG